MTPIKVNGKRTRQNPSNLRPPRPKAVHSRPYNQPALKLVIIGCGRVGSQIAANMDKAGHEVVIVDRDPNAFSRASTRGVLTREFKGDQVVGNGTDVDVLRRAGIERADGFETQLGSIVMRGDGCEVRFLAQTGIERADAIIAVTADDEDNLIALQMAKKHFRVKKTIARVNNPTNVEIFKMLGVDEAVSATDVLLGALEPPLTS